MSLLDALRAAKRAFTPPVSRTLGELSAPPNVKPADWQILSRQPFHERMGVRPAVTNSEDLRRIVALPRRPQPDDTVNAEALVELMTSRLHRENPRCRCASWGRPCITRLKPAQAWALYEAPLAGGLLGPIGVGHGKTGLDILMPMVMPGCKTAVLLIPPGLREQIVRDYLAWGEHFRVPALITERKGFLVPGGPTIHVVPFSKFSRPTATDLLESIAPDLIVIDEAHKARHPETATTGRILRYFVAHPETRLCCWSGTLTSKSVKDYSHLSALALREGSPLPLDPNVVADWALAIDAQEWPAPMGALSALCTVGEHVHSAFHRRLVDTRGVVATRAGAVDAAINLHERRVDVPPLISKMLATLRDTDAEGGWQRPDGEELVDILAVQACARQLACGFYYRWKYPKGEPAELIEDWFAKRKAWHKELREKLKNRREHLDSPFLCAKAAIRFYQDPPYEGDLPVWESLTWLDWRDVRDSVQPETEAIWVDDFLVKDAAEWAKTHRGIVWYEHDAFGRRVAELAKLALHGGGPDAERKILSEDGSRSLIASIKSHGTGRDGLQLKFKDQLVANPPSGGDAWEQLLGRLHRIGQTADEVECHVYRHTAEMADALDSAVLKAKYIQGTMGTMMKLLSLNCTFPLERS